jgi:hypothetical protein
MFFSRFLQLAVLILCCFEASTFGVVSTGGKAISYKAARPLTSLFAMMNEGMIHARDLQVFRNYN